MATSLIMIEETNIDRFDKIVDERIRKIKEILASKTKEYSPDGDRYHNFRVAARMDGITIEKALWGMLMKHLVAVHDMTHMTTSVEVTEQLIDEKIGDLINYFILLEGLFKERLSAKPIEDC